MKNAKVLFIGASLLFATGTAFADGDPAGGTPPDPNAGGAGAGAGAGVATGGAPAAPGAEAPAPKIWIGGGLELSPVGSVDNGMASADTDIFYGVDIVALYSVTPMVAVGVAPRYLLNIKGKDQQGGDSASMYDIRAVGVFHKEVASKISLMGMGGVGYASISIPDQGGVSIPAPAGLTLSFAGGAGYALSPKLVATAMLSYELGFQSVDVGGQSADYKFNHLAIGLGIIAGIK